MPPKSSSEFNLKSPNEPFQYFFCLCFSSLPKIFTEILCLTLQFNKLCIQRENTLPTCISKTDFFGFMLPLTPPSQFPVFSREIAHRMHPLVFCLNLVTVHRKITLFRLSCWYAKIIAIQCDLIVFLQFLLCDCVNGNRRNFRARTLIYSVLVHHLIPCDTLRNRQ